MNGSNIFSVFLAFFLTNAIKSTFLYVYAIQGNFIRRAIWRDSVCIWLFTAVFLRITLILVRMGVYKHGKPDKEELQWNLSFVRHVREHSIGHSILSKILNF